MEPIFKIDIVLNSKNLDELKTVLDQAKKDLASLEEKAAADELELEERLARIAGRPIKLVLSIEGQ